MNSYSNWYRFHHRKPGNRNNLQKPSWCHPTKCHRDIWSPSQPLQFTPRVGHRLIEEKEPSSGKHSIKVPVVALPLVGNYTLSKSANFQGSGFSSLYWEWECLTCLPQRVTVRFKRYCWHGSVPQTINLRQVGENVAASLIWDYKTKVICTPPKTDSLAHKLFKKTERFS